MNFIAGSDAALLSGELRHRTADGHKKHKHKDRDKEREHKSHHKHKHKHHKHHHKERKQDKAASENGQPGLNAHKKSRKKHRRHEVEGHETTNPDETTQGERGERSAKTASREQGEDSTTKLEADVSMCGVTQDVAGKRDYEREEGEIDESSEAEELQENETQGAPVVTNKPNNEMLSRHTADAPITEAQKALVSTDGEMCPQEMADIHTMEADELLKGNSDEEEVSLSCQNDTDLTANKNDTDLTADMTDPALANKDQYAAAADDDDGITEPGEGVDSPEVVQLLGENPPVMSITGVTAAETHKDEDTGTVNQQTATVSEKGSHDQEASVSPSDIKNGDSYCDGKDPIESVEDTDENPAAQPRREYDDVNRQICQPKNTLADEDDLIPKSAVAHMDDTVQVPAVVDCSLIEVQSKDTEDSVLSPEQYNIIMKEEQSVGHCETSENVKAESTVYCKPELIYNMQTNEPHTPMVIDDMTTDEPHKQEPIDEMSNCKPDTSEPNDDTSDHGMLDRISETKSKVVIQGDVHSSFCKSVNEEDMQLDLHDHKSEEVCNNNKSSINTDCLDIGTTVCPHDDPKEMVVASVTEPMDVTDAAMKEESVSGTDKSDVITGTCNSQDAISDLVRMEISNDLSSTAENMHSDLQTSEKPTDGQDEVDSVGLDHTAKNQESLTDIPLECADNIQDTNSGKQLCKAEPSISVPSTDVDLNEKHSIETNCLTESKDKVATKTNSSDGGSKSSCKHEEKKTTSSLSSDKTKKDNDKSSISKSHKPKHASGRTSGRSSKHQTPKKTEHTSEKTPAKTKSASGNAVKTLASTPADVKPKIARHHSVEGKSKSTTDKKPTTSGGKKSEKSSTTMADNKPMTNGIKRSAEKTDKLTEPPVKKAKHSHSTASTSSSGEHKHKEKSLEKKKSSQSSSSHKNGSTSHSDHNYGQSFSASKTHSSSSSTPKKHSHSSSTTMTPTGTPVKSKTAADSANDKHSHSSSATPVKAKHTSCSSSVKVKCESSTPVKLKAESSSSTPLKVKTESSSTPVKVKTESTSSTPVKVKTESSSSTHGSSTPKPSSKSSHSSSTSSSHSHDKKASSSSSNTESHKTKSSHSGSAEVKTPSRDGSSSSKHKQHHHHHSHHRHGHHSSSHRSSSSSRSSSGHHHSSSKSSLSVPRLLKHDYYNGQANTLASVKGYKYGHLMHIETDPNGGASVLHTYQDEIASLTSQQMDEFVDEYFRAVFGEQPVGASAYVMGIVHGAAKKMPDFIEYFSDEYPNMVVKAGILNKSDIETLSMSKFREQVHGSYSQGTYRNGPLLQISVVGTVHEEAGDYFPEFLDTLEADPFLKVTMPWGQLSSSRGLDRNRSNDGPILWARPGEQTVPTADMPKSPFKRKR